MPSQKEDTNKKEGDAHYLAHVGIVTIVAIVALTFVFNPPNFSSFGFAIKKTPQCSDGLDNDGNGLIDWPNDPGCYGPRDDVEAQDACTDSDNGFVIETQGTVTGAQYGKSYSKQDYCKTVYDRDTGMTRIVLIEYFCRAGEPVSNAVECQNGCVDGSCE